MELVECSLYATILINDETKLTELDNFLKIQSPYPVLNYTTERVTTFVS